LDKVKIEELRFKAQIAKIEAGIEYGKGGTKVVATLQQAVSNDTSEIFSRHHTRSVRLYKARTPVNVHSAMGDFLREAH